MTLSRTLRRVAAASIGALLVLAATLTASSAAYAADPVVSTLDAGQKTTGVAITPDGTKAYVSTNGAGSDPGVITVLDTASDTITGTIRVGRSPFGVAFTPDGTVAFVANVDSESVSVIDVATDSVTGTIAMTGGPRDLAVSPDGTKLYVATLGLNAVTVIDVATSTVTARLTVGGQPVSVAFAPDGTKAYVTNTDSDSVSVIDTATETVSGSFAVVKNPIDVVFTPDGTKAYVASLSLSAIAVIDVATNAQTGLIALEPVLTNVIELPYSLAMSPDGSVLYATLKSRTVRVIDTTTDSAVSTITGLFSGYSWGTAVAPDSSKIYTTDITVNTMSIVTFPSPVFTVAFDANGGVGTMTAQDSSSAAPLTANAFTRGGYTFAGWNTAADGGGTAYADTASYAFSASTTLYAQWALIPVIPTPTPPDALAMSVDLGIVAGAPVAGAPVSVSGAGLLDDADYTVVVRSTPITIANGVVSATGTVGATGYLPSGLAAGWHSVTFASTAADGTPASARVYFQVSANGRLLATSSTAPLNASVTGEIAATGAETPWATLWGGAVALISGFALILSAAARRRESRA